MIYLTKGQPLYDNPAMVVYDPTGYYDDGASVVCAPSYDPENPACRYEAKYIAYGNMVYTISDPTRLSEEILTIDPKSLFGKDNQDIALEKVVDNIQTIEPVQPKSNASSAEPAPQKSLITSPEEVEAALLSSTPITSETTNISSTTPTPEQSNSVTEPILEITPSVSPHTDTTTTTPSLL